MLNKYYSAELARLRANSLEFARANPAIAPMLGATSTDPDIEILLQGVAFINGMTLQKLDDEFPEVAQELASVLVPQILRPIPAATMVAFEPNVPIIETVTIPAGTELGAEPVEGLSCLFRTTATLFAHPLTLESAQFNQSSDGINTISIDFNGVERDRDLFLPDKLRLFLSDDHTAAANMLMLLRNHVKSVRVVDYAGQVVQLSSQLGFPGFSEPLIPYPDNAFPGFGLIQEMLFFPQKFLFVEFSDLAKASGRLKGTRFKIEIELDRQIGPPPEVSINSFLLNVTPVVNLFGHTAEPILLNPEISEHMVRPNSAFIDFYQVYSIDSVTGMKQGEPEHKRYEPFSSLTFARESLQSSYRSSLRPSIIHDRLDTYLSVVYSGDGLPGDETLSVRLTCTNRSLPEKLKLGDICRPTSSSPDRFGFVNITPITPAVDPPHSEKLIWDVIGHTMLNILSLKEINNLRALLGLYNSMRTQNHTGKAINERQIEGLLELAVTPETRLHRGMNIQGQHILLTCDVSNWGSKGSLYLWGCVLEAFLASYAGINSYTRFELQDKITGTVFKWPLRAGQKSIL